MRVLVTGADGFVGKHLTAHLRAQGMDVFELHGPGGPAKVSSPAIETADILDRAAVSSFVERCKPEGVIHLAGFSSVAQSHRDPATAFAVNTLGTVHLLEAIHRWAPRARTVVVSSGEVYGAIPEGKTARETDPIAPLSPYAAAKAASELAAAQFSRSYGLPVVCARPFNHLGAGQAPHFVVPSFARQLEAIRRDPATPLEVGNLEPIRDFSHVKDVVAAYLVLLQRGVAGEAYNVGSGVGRSIRSVLDALRELSGVDKEPVVDPERVRPAEIPSLVGDIGKLRALGWEPTLSVTDALRDVVDEARTTSV